MLGAAVIALIVPSGALASFPGTNPNESVRVNTPNDPGFDHCEPDDEQGPPTCSNVFDEQYERFGFAPNGSQPTALYHNPLDPHVQRLIGAEHAAGRNPLGQVPGVSADRAWKYSTGDPSVQIAILDTGIRWDKHVAARSASALNRGELPLPQHDGASDLQPPTTATATAPSTSTTTRTTRACRRPPGTTTRPTRTRSSTRSDLIAVFSDGTDDDGNGYVDDIAGWDFFDDDNDPYDASSYSSANNHGSGRAEDAAEEGNDGDGGIGVCPSCQIVPMRVWDTFVVDTQQLRAGRALRGRQQHRGRRGRGRRAVQLELRAQRVRVRLPARRVLRDRLLGPQHRRPQHPDALQRGDAGAGHRRRRPGPRA